MRIGVLTGGGDCPGLNAVIRAVVRTADARYGSTVVGFQDGWRGLLEDRRVQLRNDDRNDRLLAKGGTMLGTARVNPDKLRAGLEAVIRIHAPDLPWTVVDGQSRECMRAADAVLLASGTATLECLLLGRPMVVAYRVAPLTYRILKRLVHSPYISLPNLLAERMLVPELIQDAATPDALAQTLSPLLDGGQIQTEGFDVIHRALRHDASAQAADAVLKLVGEA